MSQKQCREIQIPGSAERVKLEAPIADAFDQLLKSLRAKGKVISPARIADALRRLDKAVWQRLELQYISAHWKACPTFDEAVAAFAADLGEMSIEGQL